MVGGISKESDGIVGLLTTRALECDLDDFCVSVNARTYGIIRHLISAQVPTCQDLPQSAIDE